MHANFWIAGSRESDFLRPENQKKWTILNRCILFVGAIGTF